MADQTFASRLARKSPEWTRQIARQAFSRRRYAIGAGTGIGVFFYLAGTMLAGIFTTGVFFGLGFYSLDHQTGENRINRTVPVSTQEETPASAEASVLEKAEQQGGKHFEPTRFGNASSDIVTGPVIEAPDAMTWGRGQQHSAPLGGPSGSPEPGSFASQLRGVGAGKGSARMPQARA